jgi:hypothetical protein
MTPPRRSEPQALQGDGWYFRRLLGSPPFGSAWSHSLTPIPAAVDHNLGVWQLIRSKILAEVAIIIIISSLIAGFTTVCMYRGTLHAKRAEKCDCAIRSIFFAAVLEIIEAPTSIARDYKSAVR